MTTLIAINAKPGGTMGKKNLLAGAEMVGTNDVALLASTLRVARMKQRADAVSRLRFRLVCSALGCMLAGPVLAETVAVTAASAAPTSAAPAVSADTTSPSD